MMTRRPGDSSRRRMRGSEVAKAESKLRPHLAPLRSLWNGPFDRPALADQSEHSTGLHSLRPFYTATLVDYLPGSIVELPLAPADAYLTSKPTFCSTIAAPTHPPIQGTALDSGISHPNVLVRPVANTSLLSSTHVLSRPLEDQVQTRNRTRVRHSSRRSHMAGCLTCSARMLRKPRARRCILRNADALSPISEMKLAPLTQPGHVLALKHPRRGTAVVACALQSQHKSSLSPPVRPNFVRSLHVLDSARSIPPSGLNPCFLFSSKTLCTEYGASSRIDRTLGGPPTWKSRFERGPGFSLSFY